MEEESILIDYSDDNSPKPIYIPTEKQSYEILNIKPTAKPVDVDTCSKSKAGDYQSSEHMYEDFYQYLISVDGGRLSDVKTSPQYSRMIQTVVSVLGGDLSELCNKKLLRKKFFGEYCSEKNYAPLTIKKYLTALQHFYTYLLDEEINVAGYASDDILKMKLRMVNWSSSYNDDVKERDNQRSEKELDVLITPEQIATFENSVDARKAIKLFAACSKDPLQPITRTDYCCMMDYLFFQIEIQNSHRSGVAANMLMEEFQNAKQDGDFMLIRVKNHKTKRDHGPAKVFVKPHIYSYLEIFVHDVRNNLPVVVDKNRVFLSFNGASMESGSISKQLNSMWQRAGVYSEMLTPPCRNLTSTIFRKTVSTACLEHRPTASGDVANLLAHSEKTQRKYYDARRMDMSTSKGAHHVELLLRYGANSSTQSPRKRWSVEEVEEIADLFQEEIGNKCVSIEDIENKRTKFTKLQYVPARKIYDKIRTIWQQRDSKSDDVTGLGLPSDTLNDRCERLHYITTITAKNTPLENAERSDSSDEDFIPPSVSASAVSTSQISGKEKVFPTDDSQKLVRWCADIIASGSINKERTKIALDDTEEKRGFLEYYGVDKIINRLKYEKDSGTTQKNNDFVIFFCVHVC